MKSEIRNPQSQILMISTDPHLIQQVRASLDEGAYELETVQTGLDALRCMYISRPDLIILDARSQIRNAVLNLSKGPQSEIRNPKFATLSRLREVTDLPILILSSPEEIAHGLSQGADDGLPVYDTQACTESDSVAARASGVNSRNRRRSEGLAFPAEELAARVGALLRRSKLPPVREWVSRYVNDKVDIDLTQKRVVVQGRWVHLTPVEFRLLACLVGNAGRLVTHEKLIAQVWGPEHVGKQGLLTPRIYKLRQKIEPDPTHHEYILTERGFGYRFKERP